MANFAPLSPSDGTGLRYFTAKLSFMPEHLPDRVDRAIVTRLQRDGRIANVDLADAVSLSPSACLRRVKALEAGGIIAGYHAEGRRAATEFLQTDGEHLGEHSTADLDVLLSEC